MRYLYFFSTLLAALTLALPTHAQSTYELSADDHRFLQLRDAAIRENASHAFELALQLTDYPIHSYVDYYALKARLTSASQSEITDYLNRYAGTAIADRLRNDWLLLLGRQGDWAMFDEQYPQFVLNDDTQLKCYALLSKLTKGEDVAADARNLLTSAKMYGEGCYPLFAALVRTEQFSGDDVWNQIRWAAESPNMTVAIELANLADLPATAAALDKTGRKLEGEFNKPLAQTNTAHQTALILLGRLARVNVDDAIRALEKIDSALTPVERNIGWAQIALPASQKLLSQANDYWKKAGDVSLSLEGFQWRTRAALRNMDWPQVQKSIEAMPPTLLSDSSWVYWLGRAYKADNQFDTALAFFQNIEDQFTFYGQLAREELGKKIVIPDATDVQQADVDAVANNEGLKNALRFYAMNLRFEGNREWNWQLRHMTEAQLLAAAEFGRQSKALDRMVNTSDRTKTIVNFNQRFPSPYKDVMAANTASQGLDMAWVYGIIRQESRFILNARSGAGATGLMQVMPATAHYVVRKAKLDNVDTFHLDTIETNIALGTHYLTIILQDLDNSEVLASAGYNAGPNRAKAWRASLPSAVEGAIFAETIPFVETRDYVKNVLSNATYYSALFSKTPQSLKARLDMVSPTPTIVENVVLKN